MSLARLMHYFISISHIYHDEECHPKRLVCESCSVKDIIQTYKGFLMVWWLEFTSALGISKAEQPTLEKLMFKTFLELSLKIFKPAVHCKSQILVLQIN